MIRLLSAVGLLASLPVFAQDAQPTVTVKKTKDLVEFSTGDKVITRYHVGESIAKPYLWPLNAPGNVPVTRGWPMQAGLPKETKDHVHQKSVWFCHGDVIPEGIELKLKVKNVTGVDFWSETTNHGKIVCVSVAEPTAAGSEAKVATKNEWRTPDGIKILDEDRTIIVRDLGDARLVILDIDLHASVCPITFGDTKEGSMGVRVSDEIKAVGGNGTLVNAEGKKNEREVWGRRSAWNNYYGKVNDEAVGIALFDHPKNAARACWHSRGYGLMAANPFGRSHAAFPDTVKETELVKIGKGGRLALRYGLLLHKGDTAAGKVAERYAAFAKE